MVDTNASLFGNRLLQTACQIDLPGFLDCCMQRCLGLMSVGHIFNLDGMKKHAFSVM